MARAFLAGRRTRGRRRRRAGHGPRHHLVGDLVVQRLGDQPALDQLGLGLERPRPDDGVGPHLADAVEAHQVVAAGGVEVDQAGGRRGRRATGHDGRCAKRERQSDQQGETFHLPVTLHPPTTSSHAISGRAAKGTCQALKFVRSISTAGIMICVGTGSPREMAQRGAGGNGGDIEGAEIDAGQHRALLDALDGAGQAVDAHHLGACVRPRPAPRARRRP